MWSGFIWLGIWTGSLLLWTQHWTLRLCKMHGISCQADHLLAALEGICCIGLVNRMYLNGICHVPFDVSDWMRIRNYKSQTVEVKKKPSIASQHVRCCQLSQFSTPDHHSPILPYLALHWFWSLQHTGVHCISTYTYDMLVLLFSSCESIQPVVQSHCCQ